MKYHFTLYCWILWLLWPLQVMHAQSIFTIKKYPQSFISPIDFPVSIVGNFGECRPNHFHSGIDIRTNGQENKIIRAIGNGYISRVKIEAGGFGNAIYITHGAYTSVYAHLNKFFPELEQYVRAQQYKKQTWAIDLTFSPHQFPVKQGTFIAYSGNTGSSQGPHLHMEIRDTQTDAPLNGLLFYNWQDSQAPLINTLAIYDGQQSIYAQQPKLIKLNHASLPKKIIKVNTPLVYFGIEAVDKMNIATGTLGIFEMRLFVNDQPYFAWQMDNISYNITRYMNAIADYKTRKNNGPWIQLCASLPNDKLPVYKDVAGKKGIVGIEPGETKKIRIEVLDTRNQKSVIAFSIVGEAIKTATMDKQIMKAGQTNSFSNEFLQLVLPADVLYDNINFTTSIKPSIQPYSYIYQVHTAQVPLHHEVDVYFTPKTHIPQALQNKIAVIKLPSANETKKKGMRAEWQQRTVKASIKEFGWYEIVIDQQAPSITSTIKNNDTLGKRPQLNFVIKDDITSVKSVKMYVDDQWLRVVQKGDVYTYEIDEYFPAGTHTLKVIATDENDNMKTNQYSITR